MKRLLVLVFLIGMMTELIAQPADQAKLSKDLEIATNILASLLSPDLPRWTRSGGSEVTGRYVDGYGVVLHVPALSERSIQTPMIMFSPRVPAPPPPPVPPNRPRRGAHSFEVEVETLVEIDDDHDQSVQHYREGVFRDFLADYGHLIRQLAPANQIKIQTTSSGSVKFRNTNVEIEMRETQRSGAERHMSVEVKKSDLNNFEGGTISREELIDRMTVTYQDRLEVEPQLRLLAATLYRQYSVGSSRTYYLNRIPQLYYLPGTGVKYVAKVYSSTVHSDGTYSLPTLGRERIAASERNKLVQEVYPEFVRSMKESLLDYGSILSHLPEDESITMEIGLTSCEGCNMPLKIALEVKKSVLVEYRAGRLTLDQALEAVTETVLSGQ